MKIKKELPAGIVLLSAFVLWTFLVLNIDVRFVGQKGTAVGFASLNTWFHQITGVHMWLYTVTDWLGFVPIVICLCFAVFGLVQLIKRKSLFKVDPDILLLGVYYILVIFCYLIFEMIPINYRPVPINGYMEASYPSSTTLLVLSVMPTLVFQVSRRCKNQKIKRITLISALVFSLFMVIGRSVSGVHWLTDIIGSIILSAGLFELYKAVVLYADERKDYGI